MTKCMLCGIYIRRDVYLQYPNWPIYPFYNLLKIMYNRDTRLFYKYSGVEGE